ncbi:MAG: hypothetical protein R2695_02745 [Acidimicrobiales bacterium]
MRTRRALLASLAAVVLAMSFVVTAPPVEAQSSDGLRTTASTVYRVRPDERRVDVEIRQSFTNQVPNRTEGNTIVRTYFTSVVLVAPTAAVALEAHQAGGGAVAISPGPLTAEEAADLATSGLTAWTVDLGPNLFSGQTRDLVVTFQLPDGPPRSEDTWARVNPAFAAFPVLARGDAGRSSVRVEIPDRFVVEVFGSTLPPATGQPAGVTAFEATAIENPGEWIGLVVASSDEGLSRREVTVDGVDGDLAIASWPGDTEWDQFVEAGFSDGIPALEEAIGVPWPLEGELQVRETVAPSLAGYGGWYFEPEETTQDDATIEVGEDLDHRLLAHELAHAWFNDDFSGERWINEGLAELFGQRIGMGLDPGAGAPFDEVERDDPAALALDKWDQPTFDDGESPTEAYGYAASFQVMSAVAEEIGDEALSDTIASLWDRENPYRRELDDPGAPAVGWRDFVDAVEIVGGSERVVDLVSEWVLASPLDTDALDARQVARDEYASLAERDPGWQVPDVIPDLLADWRFARAAEHFEEIDAILDDAQALAEAAAARAVDLPGDVQEAYETAAPGPDPFVAVRESLDVQTVAFERVADAQDRADSSPGPIERIGLLGAGLDGKVGDAIELFEAADYDGATAAAAAIEARRDDAASVGLRRLLLALGVVGLVFVAWVLLRRRRRERVDVVDEAELVDVGDEATIGAEAGGFAVPDPPAPAEE